MTDLVDVLPPIQLYAFLAATATLMAMAAGKAGTGKKSWWREALPYCPLLLAWIHVAGYIVWTLVEALWVSRGPEPLPAENLHLAFHLIGLAVFMGVVFHLILESAGRRTERRASAAVDRTDLLQAVADQLIRDLFGDGSGKPPRGSE